MFTWYFCSEIACEMYAWFALMAEIRAGRVPFLSCPPVYSIYTFMTLFYGQIKKKERKKPAQNCDDEELKPHR